MSNTLTLNASGTGGCSPDQDPWTPTSGGSVTITNSSGAQQVLSGITSGLLNPAPGGSITVPTTGWSGTVGTSNGTYSYNDGSTERGMRNGTTDPS